MIGFRSESGVANVIEYMLIMPLCLIGICFIFVVGYRLHQTSVLEAAVYRAATVAQRMYTDPNCQNFMDLGTDGEKFVGYQGKTNADRTITSDPYRFFNQNYKLGDIDQAAERKMRAVIGDATLTKVKKLYVEEAVKEGGDPDGCTDITGFINREARLVVTQKFKVPKVFKLVGLDQNLDLKVELKAPMIAQTEFLRNTMFAGDLFEKLDKDGNITKPIRNVFGRISDFFKN